MTDEVWRPVAGWEGLYEVSDQGRARSLDRTIVRADGQTRFKPGRVLCTNANDGGYLSVRLCDERGQIDYKVHHLVLEAFIGQRPDDQECLHRNDVPADNRLVNLRWGTHAENIDQRKANGGYPLPDDCINGHPFTPENTGSVINRDGVRQCRTCRREAARRYRQKRKSAA